MGSNVSPLPGGRSIARTARRLGKKFIGQGIPTTRSPSRHQSIIRAQPLFARVFLIFLAMGTGPTGPRGPVEPSDSRIRVAGGVQQPRFAVEDRGGCTPPRPPDPSTRPEFVARAADA